MRRKDFTKRLRNLASQFGYVKFERTIRNGKFACVLTSRFFGEQEFRSSAELIRTLATVRGIKTYGKTSYQLLRAMGC